MAADENALAKLHVQLASVLTDALKGQSMPGYDDPTTGEHVEAITMPPSAAIMTVAAKFLKDNNITCTPAEDNELGELAATMAARQRKLRGVDQTERDMIADSSRFMGSA